MDSFSLISSPFKGLSFISFSSSNAINYSTLSFLRFKNSERFKKASLSVKNSLDPQKPGSVWGSYGFSVKPFSYLIPLIQKATDFAMKSSKQKWDLSCGEAKLLQNGAFGTALMSVTATAKVKISPFVATLAANPTFVSALCAWAAAQSMKVFLNFCVERKWDFRIMFSCGGMPSSHSALCTALTASVAICHGIADSLFPVCLGFSLIVMYDAIGVRRHAGMQAEVLNLIVADLFQGHPISQRKLKELLGHTPSQVFAGALLGILVAWMCCQVCPFPA
ncbi:Acid phosphatase/vanadium-dependent haloperoxidase-related protein [Perilla frutescens var. hirtella]|uniref:Acid phosphatase/vanadium-dependent haloperoxidase-related protein n=1 Tax=Perilla frutescens var. hirtella TaxID=608512 RepID=A0AAD4NY92_PERFH|nr:Acid phosphatase/vanadium-dependent haloperoxidase-related protein [Perilla frutescens var. hirtella]